MWATIAHGSWLAAILLLSVGHRAHGQIVTTPLPPMAMPSSDGPGVTDRQLQDESLPAETYIREGMPAHDRKWSNADMKKAFEVLQKVAQDRRRLPRFKSERSGKLFDRIVSEENLTVYQDPAFNLTNRFHDYAEYAEGLTGISKMYLAAASHDVGFGREAAEIVGANLRSSRLAFKLVDEKVATYDKADSRYPARMAAIEKIRRGMATAVAGSFQMLEDFPGEHTDVKKAMLGHLKAYLPEILPRLPPGSRAEFPLRVRELARKTSLKELQADLTKLAVLLEKKAAEEKDSGK